MRILLTNDDGIVAPGLAAMYTQLTKLGDVTVVAPDSHQSAMAHSITIEAPLSVTEMHINHLFHGFAVGGSPADCVKLAVRSLMDTPPDLVVSGINDGANISINVLYSGTVAAAAEGALFGIPSVAISLEHAPELDFDHAAEIARDLLKGTIIPGIQPGQLINVNIPNLSPGKPRGIKVVPQATETMHDWYDKILEPDGSVRYRLCGAFKENAPPDTDMAALIEGYVAVTPLHFNMTEDCELDTVNSWKWPKKL